MLQGTLATVSIQISHEVVGVYATLRVRLVVHPSETIEFLWARVLARGLFHENGLTFSEGLYKPHDPTLWNLDVTGEILTWIDVGHSSVKRILHYRRKHPKTQVRCFQYSINHLASLERELRVEHKQPEDVGEVWMVDLEDLAKNGILEMPPKDVSMTIVDNVIYVTSEGINATAPLKRYY